MKSKNWLNQINWILLLIIKKKEFFSAKTQRESRNKSHDLINSIMPSIILFFFLLQTHQTWIQEQTNLISSIIPSIKKKIFCKNNKSHDPKSKYRITRIHEQQQQYQTWINKIWRELTPKSKRKQQKLRRKQIWNCGGDVYEQWDRNVDIIEGWELVRDWVLDEDV